MLWGDLHTLFEPDEDDEIWKYQHEYKLLSWRLYDFYGIHILLMENGLAIHMLIKKKYPLSQEMIFKMLKKKLEVDIESSQAIELLRFIRSQEKELKLLMVKGADLEISMHGDYYGLFVTDPKRWVVSFVKDSLCSIKGDPRKNNGKIWDNVDVHDLRSIETEFPSIVFTDTLTSEAALRVGYGKVLLTMMKLTLEYRLTNPTMKIAR
ncbi:hypothetical protein Tco_0206406 [Tanacetum coccineum]